MCSALSDLDIYISPLFLGTGMKNKILQTMGVGVPLIASKISVAGITQLSNGKNCFVCDDDPEMWLNYINTLICDADLRKQFSASTKSIISSEYSWNSFSNYVLSLLQ